MLKYLLDHAIRNVWCSPYQDDQALLQLTRITSVNRAKNYIDYQYRRQYLPTQNEYYHVYLIGANTQERLNLTNKINTWVDFSELAVENNLVANFYTLSGHHLSRKRCYVLRGDKGNYWIAIKMHEGVIDLDSETIYLRLYRDAYYGSSHDTSGAIDVRYGGGLVNNSTEALAYQRNYLTAAGYPEGHACALLNGYLVDNFLPNEIKKGDIVEWTYESSVDEIYEIALNDLVTFTSTLDQMMKYIIHLPKKTDNIRYKDDIDIWVIQRRENNRWRGVWYNQNQSTSVRMLTHRDYAIPTVFVKDLIEKNAQIFPDMVNATGIYLQIHVRKSGYQRPLVDEANRIKELYKLTDVEIVRAMAGIDATVPEWQAANLERSSYTAIMREPYEQVTANQVVTAYGYNAMTKLVADTPNKVSNGFVNVPLAHRVSSTAFEYNAQGIMLGWRKHLGGDVYYPMYSATTMMEFIEGEGGLGNNIVSSNSLVTLDPNIGYRFYVTRVSVDGTPENEWIDVTNNNQYYTINSNNQVIWSIDNRMWLGAVKSNENFTCFDLDIIEYNHMYRFSLINTDFGDVLYIPPGRIDIIMNGRALIENIDYHVRYPEIVIYNKEYLKDGVQNFVIRAYGFCNSDMTRTLALQKGYIIDGMASVNNTYDVRDDKVIRVVIDGRTFHRNDVKFAETQRNIIIDGIKDGRPYVIQDAIVPLRGVIDYNTYPLRDEAIATDKRVSDYLTLKLPEARDEIVDTIPDVYQIYSPFLARVLYDLWAGFIPALAPEDTEENVDKLMQPYLWLLNYDPCRRDYVDDRFVNIHPHPKKVVLSITKAQYSFLERLNEIYLFSRVDLTPFLQIVGEGHYGQVVDPPVNPDPGAPAPVYPLYSDLRDNINFVVPEVTSMVLTGSTPAIEYDYSYLISDAYPTIDSDRFSISAVIATSATLRLSPTANVADAFNVGTPVPSFEIWDTLLQSTSTETVAMDTIIVTDIEFVSAYKELASPSDTYTVSTPTITSEIWDSLVPVNDSESIGPGAVWASSMILS